MPRSPEAIEGEEMNCPNCGAVLRLATRRCSGCGADLRAGPTVAANGGMGTGELAPNTLLQGRYRIQRKLGRGSFGQVYLAHDGQAGGLQVAIKALRTDDSRSEDEAQEAIAWFKREVGHLLTLEHPRLPAVHGYWTAPEEPGTLYLAMDYIPGDTLDLVLKKHGGPLPWRRVLGWGLVLSDVLTYLHGRMPPIVFRDLKLQNVILDSRSDTPSLIDFGIARPHSAAGGTAIGTWGYAPLEQILGKAEPRSDLYALGAVLHALLTGRDPEVEMARLQRSGKDLQAALAALFPPAGSLVPALPAEVTAAITLATAIAPDARFRDAPAMAAALQRVLDGQAPAPAARQGASKVQDRGPEPVPAAVNAIAAPAASAQPAAVVVVQREVAVDGAAPGAAHAHAAVTEGHFRPLSGQDLAVGGAAAGLLASILPWYSSTVTVVSYSSGSSENGWHQWGFLAILSFLAAAAFAVLPPAEEAAAALAPSLAPGRAGARAVAICGFAAVLSVALYLSVIGPDTSGPGVRTGSSWGLWLAAAAGIAVVAGGMRMAREQAR